MERAVEEPVTIIKLFHVLHVPQKVAIINAGCFCIVVVGDGLQVAAAAAASSDAGQEDGWVVCRVFKKKHHHKESGSGGGGRHGSGRVGDGGKSAAAAHRGLQYSSSDDALDQILQYMGRSCKQEHEQVLSPQGGGGGAGGPRYLRPIDTVLGGHGFMKLPPLESPSAAALTPHLSAAGDAAATSAGDDLLHGAGTTNGITDWAMMDRLVASHLNGQAAADAAAPASHQLCFDDGPGADDADGLAFYAAATTRLLAGGGSSDDDLWSFTRSSAPPGAAATSTERLSHVSL